MGFRKLQKKLENIDLRLFSAFQDLHRTGCSLFCGEDAQFSFGSNTLDQLEFQLEKIIGI